MALLAIKTPEQLDAARDLISEHLAEPDAHGHGHLPEWRLIVAPWPAEIIEWLAEDGDPVSEGQPLVRVQPPTGGPGGWVPPESREGA